MKRLFNCFLLIIFLTVAGCALFPNCALAMLRQHHDAPGVLRYHSQVSIKDDNGYSWQVLLFRKNKLGEKEDINLRLVGFPGVYDFSHPQDLEIITSEGKLLNATDIYAEVSPAPNVGEYSFTRVLPELWNNKSANFKSVKLLLPLQGEKSLNLDISSDLVTEWQWFVDEFE
ncbi:MAG: DUF3122 domain-containing protein [Cyanobacteria bacterium P01_A01_bin.84]